MGEISQTGLIIILVGGGLLLVGLICHIMMNPTDLGGIQNIWGLIIMLIGGVVIIYGFAMIIFIKFYSS